MKISRVPCPSPYCTQKARVFALTSQDQYDRKRMTHLSLRCRAGHMLSISSTEPVARLVGAMRRKFS